MVEKTNVELWDASKRKLSGLVKQLREGIEYAEQVQDLSLKHELMMSLDNVLEHLKVHEEAHAEDDFEPQEDITEWMEEEEPVTGGEEGMGTRQGPPLEAFKGEEPEGLGPSEIMGGDISGMTLTQDKMDRLFEDPRVREELGKKL